MARLLLVVIVAFAGTASAKPLLQGQYEVVKFKQPGGKEVDLSKMLAQGDTVWGRWVLTFEGDKITMTMSNLDLEKGVYTACEAEVTIGVDWTAKGFTIPASVNGKGTAYNFQKLTADSSKNTAIYCSASLEKLTMTVTAGKEPKLVSDKGTIFLVPLVETKIDWSKHVKR